MSRAGPKRIMALADAYVQARPGSRQVDARAALEAALQGRKPRGAGARFERRIAKDLKAALGPGWNVQRNQNDRQKGQGGCAGEFSIEWIQQPANECEHDWIVGPTVVGCARCGDSPADARKALTASAPVFPFCIECKTGGGFTYFQPWKSPITGPLPKWWAQACRQAESVDKRPMLVFTSGGNGAPVLCAVMKADPVGFNNSGSQMWIDGMGLRVLRWADVVKHAGRWV